MQRCERVMLPAECAERQGLAVLRTPEGTLRALNVPMEIDPRTGLPNVQRAIKKAIVYYHPDKHQVHLRAFCLVYERPKRFQGICIGT